MPRTINYRRKTICLNDETVAIVADLRKVFGVSDSEIIRMAIKDFNSRAKPDAVQV